MNSKLKEFLSTAIFFLAVVLISFLVVKFVAQRTEVIGSSMMDTLEDGDNLILDKVSYKFSDPKRFDIVVFPYREDTSKKYIKRIIGLPGETVRIDADGKIYINGEELYESYGREVIQNPGLAAEEITLKYDEYFVLGDNRNNSEDSRFADVGNIDRSEIIGKVWIRIWPLGKFGSVDK